MCVILEKGEAVTAQIELMPEEVCRHEDEKEKYIRSARTEAILYAISHGTVSSDVLQTPRPRNVHPNASGAIFKMPSIFRAVRPKKSRSALRNGGFIWIWELADLQKALEYLNGKAVGNTGWSQTKHDTPGTF